MSQDDLRDLDKIAKLCRENRGRCHIRCDNCDLPRNILSALKEQEPQMMREVELEKIIMEWFVTPMKDKDSYTKELIHALAGKIPKPQVQPDRCEGNKMIDFTQKVESYLDDFTDKEGCSFISEDVDRIKWAVTTIAEKVFGYDKLEKPTEPKCECKEPNPSVAGYQWCGKCGKPIPTEPKLKCPYSEYNGNCILEKWKCPQCNYTSDVFVKSSTRFYSSKSIEPKREVKKEVNKVIEDSKEYLEKLADEVECTCTSTTSNTDIFCGVCGGKIKRVKIPPTEPKCECPNPKMKSTIGNECLTCGKPLPTDKPQRIRE